MLKNVKLRAQKVGLDRDDFELEVQPIPVRVERSRKERIVELARMVSGENVSDEALCFAKTLLDGEKL